MSNLTETADLRAELALEALNRRVTSQRFVLRTLDELGRSLTAAEYRAARDRIADPQRISSPTAGQPPLKRPTAGSTPAWGTAVPYYPTQIERPTT